MQNFFVGQKIAQANTPGQKQPTSVLASLLHQNRGDASNALSNRPSPIKQALEVIAKPGEVERSLMGEGEAMAPEEGQKLITGDTEMMPAERESQEEQ